MEGQIELKRHRARAAEVALRTALEYDPRLLVARLELIRLFSRQQRTGERDQQCRAVAAQNALDFEHLRFWTLTRNVPWNPEGDLDLLAKSVAADPEDRASRLALALALDRLGRGDEAESVLTLLHDSNPDIQVVRARLALTRGDLELAARLVSEGPERYPGLARLRGLIALAKRDAGAAVHHLAIACEVDPDDRSVQSALRVAARLSAETSNSLPDLAPTPNYKAIDDLVGRLSEPDAQSNAPLLRQMGAACESIGRKDEARAWYQLAVGAILSTPPLSRESSASAATFDPAPITPARALPVL